MISTIDYFEERGAQRGQARLLGLLISQKFGISPEKFQTSLERLGSGRLEELGKQILLWDSFEEVQRWIEQRTSDSSS
jgi:hypothetical protein